MKLLKRQARAKRRAKSMRLRRWQRHGGRPMSFTASKFGFSPQIIPWWLR